MNGMISKEEAAKIVERYDMNFFDEWGMPVTADKFVVAMDMAVTALREWEPVVRCKDCKHRIVNENYGKKGYLGIKAMCDVEGDIFDLSRYAWEDEWFCAEGERKESDG